MTVTAEPLPELAADALVRARPANLWRDTLANVLRQRSAVVGLTILAALFLVAIFADLIAPYPPNQSMLDLGEKVSRQQPATLRPCVHALGCAADRPQHLFGLDGNLRDEFSRVVHGSRTSLRIGFLTVGFAIVVGTLIGAVAGYAGGWVDNVLMRLMDIVLSFPSLLLAIAIVTVLGSSLINAQLAIGVVAIPIYARVMRASVLATREADYIAASRALGESSTGLLLRRILPNSLTPLIVQGTLGIGGAILEVAALSFIGLGAQPPLAEWGAMISLDRNLINAAPHLLLFPGIAITLTVLGFNLLGDGLRDALDPRLNR
ncbi:MAG TPA: ABC transporter permease [Candidatus Limnocylindrales bacterium]|jgi:ABC-type dipeptide/oligopeptide/nickel transport system permease subunit|nr:ABC transporter permease [Candidatus Limnocylindrales bacterium]